MRSRLLPSSSPATRRRSARRRAGCGRPRAAGVRSHPSARSARRRARTSGRVGVPVPPTRRHETDPPGATDRRAVRRVKAPATVALRHRGGDDSARPSAGAMRYGYAASIAGPADQGPGVGIVELVVLTRVRAARSMSRGTRTGTANRHPNSGSTMITAVAFTTVSCGDQERAKRFYTDVLGFELHRDEPMGDSGRSALDRGGAARRRAPGWCCSTRPTRPAASPPYVLDTDDVRGRPAPSVAGRGAQVTGAAQARGPGAPGGRRSRTARATRSVLGQRASGRGAAVTVESRWSLSEIR